MSLDINTSKTIGGIGALLVFISVFTSFLQILYVPNIMMVLGIILILTGLYGLSIHYRDTGIFKKSLIGTVMGIIGIVVAVIILFALLLPSLVPLVQMSYPGWDGNWNTLPNMTLDTSLMDSNAIWDTLSPILTNIIILFAVLCIFSIIATFFIRQSLKQLREKSDIGLFETTGTLMLIGGFLTIILIGYILIWISVLLLAIAFFQIKPQEPTPQYDTYQPSPPPIQ
ncbi:DUF996 domain-containing protein [Candidatus Bathycorpusculum sp.]|uniref:DUF996 domain-containing protein n=1 Tax=Candidatus Bathycorpusculum sp. TaxID=2994959 RepID=UPI00282C7E23|nr:DUF996 domain-containing protein [Candidatus Termitimicrobium sp.]MCL2685014.1 DUF996 domain-containing protein [Candidatus Termitimicrobium sp.]